MSTEGVLGKVLKLTWSHSPVLIFGPPRVRAAEQVVTSCFRISMAIVCFQWAVIIRPLEGRIQGVKMRDRERFTMAPRVGVVAITRARWEFCVGIPPSVHGLHGTEEKTSAICHRVEIKPSTNRYIVPSSSSCLLLLQWRPTHTTSKTRDDLFYIVIASRCKIARRRQLGTRRLPNL